MKSIKLVIFVLAIFIIVACKMQMVVSADQDVIIIKYEQSIGKKDISDEALSNGSVTINNIPIENYSNQLIPVSNVHYHIQQVKPTSKQNICLSDSLTYTKIGKVIDIKANNSGEAVVKLTDGYYIISEELNSESQNSSQPVVLKLLESDNLNKVYVYLKPNTNGKKVLDSSTLSIDTTNQYLPKTGDTFLSDSLSFLGIFIVLFSFSAWHMSTKQSDKYNVDN